MPNRRNIFRFPSPWTDPQSTGETTGHRSAPKLALAGILAVVIPPVVAASPPGAGIEAGACASCTARHQAFQRARQANLQEGCAPADLVIRHAGPCLPTDTQLHKVLPPMTDGDLADAPQRPGHDKVGPE